MESLKQIISNIIATVTGIDFIFMSFLQHVCNRSYSLLLDKAPEIVSAYVNSLNPCPFHLQSD